MTTALSRWRPFEDLVGFRTRLDEMLEDIASGHEGRWHPDIDVVRKNGSMVVRADVPGMKPEEIEIEVADDMLTISGKHEESKEEQGKDERVVRRERHFGSFTRSLSLPSGVKPDDISAKCKDGVLEVEIQLPATEKSEPVKIVPSAS